MIPPEFKKFIAFGSGIGIHIAGPHGAESLHIAAARVRPRGARLLHGLSLENFASQPAGISATEYAAFIRKLDLRHVAATVLLPRRDVIVRQIALPGVSDKDLPTAVEFQLEGLHPYPEDEAASSWARLPGTPGVLVAIARKAAIERYAALFAEAGIKIGAFTCSAAAIYSALRLIQPAPPRELLAAEPVDGQMEYYGESPARPLFSASFDPAEPRAAALACSELRLAGAAEPLPLDRALGAAPALPFAAALVSACPRLSLSLNLLPIDRRQTSSRAAWIPAAVAAGLALTAAAALAAFPSFEDSRFQNSLQREIRKVQPLAARAGRIDREIDDVRRRELLLDSFRRRAKSDLDAMAELTRILPPPAWVNLLEINRDQVVISGEAEQAAGLLKTIDSSPFFEGSEFLLPPIRSGQLDQFRIRSKREAGR